MDIRAKRSGKLQESYKIICEAIEKYHKDKIRVAWYVGKDSTIVLYFIILLLSFRFFGLYALYRRS